MLVASNLNAAAQLNLKWGIKTGLKNYQAYSEKDICSCER